MSDKDEKDIASGSASVSSSPKSVGRRALLKGGVAAMPAILTLQSGAALAQSSNMMISAAHPKTKDSLGRTLCLDTNSVYPAEGHNSAYDMGSPPKAHVNIISKRKYYRSDSRRSGRVYRGEMCRGGTYWHEEGGNWKSVDLPYKGIVVSSGSMYSVAEHVTDDLI